MVGRLNFYSNLFRSGLLGVTSKHELVDVDFDKILETRGKIVLWAVIKGFSPKKVAVRTLIYARDKKKSLRNGFGPTLKLIYEVKVRRNEI